MIVPPAPTCVHIPLLPTEVGVQVVDSDCVGVSPSTPLNKLLARDILMRLSLPEHY